MHSLGGWWVGVVVVVVGGGGGHGYVYFMAPMMTVGLEKLLGARGSRRDKDEMELQCAVTREGYARGFGHVQ